MVRRTVVDGEVYLHADDVYEYALKDAKMIASHYGHGAVENAVRSLASAFYFLGRSPVDD